jgi:hypothetical protein
MSVDNAPVTPVLALGVMQACGMAERHIADCLDSAHG